MLLGYWKPQQHISYRTIVRLTSTNRTNSKDLDPLKFDILWMVDMHLNHPRVKGIEHACNRSRMTLSSGSMLWRKQLDIPEPLTPGDPWLALKLVLQ
jgi:hypothetical protein